MDIQRNRSSAPSLTKAEVFDFELLDLLACNPCLTQREIAARLSISLGRANSALKALREENGLAVRRLEKAGPRSAHAYVLTRRGQARRARLARRVLAAKRAEHERLGERIEALTRELDAGEDAR